jgi:hypothetical protein
MVFLFYYSVLYELKAGQSFSVLVNLLICLLRVCVKKIKSHFIAITLFNLSKKGKKYNEKDEFYAGKLKF